jgi:hypothetical protein
MENSSTESVENEIIKYGEFKHMFAVYDIYNPHIHDINGMRKYLNGKLIPSCTFTSDEYIKETDNGGMDEYMSSMHEFYNTHHKLLVRRMKEVMPGYEHYLKNSKPYQVSFVKVFYESKDVSMFDDPEMICVDKTFWIRILQRHIRKWLEQKRRDKEGYSCVVM